MSTGKKVALRTIRGVRHQKRNDIKIGIKKGSLIT
jgi:hypothetical protein